MRLGGRIRVSLHAVRVSAANGDLRLLQLARLASVTGRWAYTVTLGVYAYLAAGATGVAVAGLVRLVPAALAAPLAGALVQRTRVDVVLLRGGVVRTLALAGAGTVVFLHAPSAAVYALVAVESASSTLLRPLQNTLLPSLSRTPEELTSTNLALSVIESAGLLLGPLTGAVLLHDTSIGVVFVASAACYLASTLLVLPIPVPATVERPAGVARSRGILDEAIRGAREVFGIRDTGIVVLLYGAQNLVAGAVNVLIVVVALKLLGLGRTGVGTLTAALGVGGVIGGAVVLARLGRRRHGADLMLGLLLWGVPLAILGLTSSRVLAFVLLGVVGVGVTLVDVAALSLLQRHARTSLLPHALGLLQTIFVTSIGVGTLLAPALVSLVGIRGALLVTGAVLPILAVSSWHRLRLLDANPAADTELIRLLEAIPIFAPLSAVALERLAAALRPIDVRAGEMLFEQGDDGDAFFVIEAGEVKVLVDGEPRRVLGAGGYFGEIALLRDVPRTASVEARTDAQLLRLERAPFIATVTGNAESAQAAHAVVGARLLPEIGLTSV